MFRLAMLSVAAAAALNLTGCASIVNGQNQSLSVTARKDGTDVAGAKCSLVNDKGTWYVTTPGSVMVHRSFQDLAVKCAVESEEAALTTIKSATKGMAFGNVLFGGVIGAGVDMATGAAYDYPEIIVVTLAGKTAPTSPSTASAPAQTTLPSATTPALAAPAAPVEAAASAPAAVAQPVQVAAAAAAASAPSTAPDAAPPAKP